jgi:hypothetical protein
MASALHCCMCNETHQVSCRDPGPPRHLDIAESMRRELWLVPRDFTAPENDAIGGSSKPQRSGPKLAVLQDLGVS